MVDNNKGNDPERMEKMSEFVSFSKMADEAERIEKAKADAGICEVYRVYDYRHLNHFHTDYVGEFIGEEITVIPQNAEVRYTVMDEEEYDQTLLANCGGDPADFVCPETGKVLVVQYYISE